MKSKKIFSSREEVREYVHNAPGRLIEFETRYDFAWFSGEDIWFGTCPGVDVLANINGEMEWITVYNPTQ
jgi:hypothetical protein